MKTMALKIYLSTLLLLVSGIAQASINIGFSPVVYAGNTLNVGIVISGLGTGTAPSLGAYDLDLSFDNSHLNFTGVVFGDSVLGNQLDLSGQGSLSGSDSSSPGFLNLYEVSLDSINDLNDLQADNFTLATLTFSVLPNASSQLNFSNINALGDADGEPLGATVTSTTITTVPLPSAAFMLLSGLLSLGALRLKRSAD